MSVYCFLSPQICFVPLTLCIPTVVLSAVISFRSTLFWDVTQLILVVTDVSGQPIDPILKNLAGQEDLDCLPLKKVPDKLFRNVDNYPLTFYTLPVT